MLVRLGMPAAAEPCSRAEAPLDTPKPLSVLTTSTETNPSPSMVLAGTETVSWVGRLLAVGIIGPALREPREVATKKLTLEPVVKFDPTMLKLAPAKITQGMPLMTGGIGVGVAVGLGVRVGVVVGVAVRL